MFLFFQNFGETVKRKKNHITKQKKKQVKCEEEEITHTGDIYSLDVCG